jgi:hypothetical protein
MNPFPRSLESASLRSDSRDVRLTGRSLDFCLCLRAGTFGTADTKSLKHLMPTKR